MERPVHTSPLQKPAKLAPGARIATVSSSWGGPGLFPHRYETGKRQLMECFQVEVVEMPHTLHPPGWLARHPEARARDLMAAFADPTIDGIIATIGGHDSIRRLRYLDLDVIRRNPKVYMGYIRSSFCPTVSWPKLTVLPAVSPSSKTPWPSWQRQDKGGFTQPCPRDGQSPQPAHMLAYRLGCDRYGKIDAKSALIESSRRFGR